MRSTLPVAIVLAVSAGLLSCGGAESGNDGPACGGGFAEETGRRYGYDPRGSCLNMGYFSGVAVQLPAIPAERGWVLSGTVGDEPFTCTVVPGMVEGEPCSPEPKIRWVPGRVELYAHPCEVSLTLAVEGETVATGRFEPDYEWSEPNGDGCGWVGEATVVLVPDEV